MDIREIEIIRLADAEAAAEAERLVDQEEEHQHDETYSGPGYAPDLALRRRVEQAQDLDLDYFRKGMDPIESEDRVQVRMNAPESESLRREYEANPEEFIRRRHDLAARVQSKAPEGTARIVFDVRPSRPIPILTREEHERAERKARLMALRAMASK